MIKITFPDGSVREYESGVTGLQIAESISQRLAQEVLSVGVNGQTVELNRPITEDAEIALYNGRTPKANTPSGTPRLTSWQKPFKNSGPAPNLVSVPPSKTDSTMM